MKTKLFLHLFNYHESWLLVLLNNTVSTQHANWIIQTKNFHHPSITSIMVELETKWKEIVRTIFIPVHSEKRWDKWKDNL